jgi:two-component system, cell cycle sensor histidine kinase and response regulator CckA
MNLEKEPRAMDANEEIPALIETLLATEQRLEELTGGEVDTVAGRDGRTFLLRRAQEQLRYSEAAKQAAILNELRVLFDMVPAMIWFKDTENGFLRVNKLGAAATGRLVEEIEGKSAYEIIPQEAAGHYADDLEVIHSGAPKMGIVEKLRGSNGKALWVQTDRVPVLDKDGKVTGLVVMAQDISERKQAEEELRESERRFSDMLGNLELVSLMLDRDARITYCNDYLLRLTGWQRAEVIGRDWFELFVPPELVGELQGVHSALLADQPAAWHHEHEIVTRSGARRFIRWNNSVLRSASGDVIGTASVGEDITERERLEAQLLQSQKLETVGKLAGGIAHEFNSILTAIIGQSELLLGDLPPGSPLAKNATEIRQAAERAATLTRQLLAYGRKQILQPEILDLNSVLAVMGSTVRHLMGRGTDVSIAPAAGLKAVKADASQIQQVVMNMAMNAADAMPNGGKLTIETANVTLDEAYLSRFPELKPGEYVMLAITDTGAGMNEEVKARVFEPFFTTKGVGQGTGLGLSTCYGIVKQSGGHISVYSEPARGATFKIYLPQVEPQTRIPIQRLDSPGLPRGTETILLVEDDPALREMAATLLRRLGYTVLAADNGIEALSLKQQRDNGHIDLLFADVVMQHMSGKELSERARALHPSTRILFTSACTENATVHQGVLNEGVALLQKPFTPSALARKVREVLDQPSAPKSGLSAGEIW